MKNVSITMLSAPAAELDPVVVRHITTSAMQRRFTIKEEAAIVDLAPTELKLARDRMLNASFVDLDLQEVIDGVTGIASFLATVDNSAVPGTKLVTDEAAWIADKLRDGADTEV